MNKQPPERWVVDVRNRQSGSLVSSRYFNSEAQAMLAYWRAKVRHDPNPLIDVKVYHSSKAVVS